MVTLLPQAAKVFHPPAWSGGGGGEVTAIFEVGGTKCPNQWRCPQFATAFEGRGFLCGPPASPAGGFALEGLRSTVSGREWSKVLGSQEL